MGTKKAKPLWTEIMELLGGEYSQVKDSFYAEGDGVGLNDEDDDMPRYPTL